MKTRTVPEIPDWMRCINCKARARRGVIIHYPTCPEYPRNPKATSGAGRASTPPEGHPSPVDACKTIVSKLTPARRRDRYVCPSCGDERHGGLKVEIGAAGGILLWCFGCCTPGEDNQAQLHEILAAIGLDWSVMRGGSLRSPTSPARRARSAHPSGDRR